MAMDTRKPKSLYPVRGERSSDLEVRISLTTICIKTGVVRVPRRHHEVFADKNGFHFEGEGFSAPIRYEQSGRLTGFREVFLKEDVNPNDFLLLHLTAEGASIELVKRARTKRDPEATQLDASRADTKEPLEVKPLPKKRRVRIDVQQYYPIEKPLMSSLVNQGAAEQASKTPMVTARKVPSSPVQQQHVMPPFMQGGQEEVAEEWAEKDLRLDGGEPYAVSSDFERWLEQGAAESPQQHSAAAASEKDQSLTIAEVVSQIENFLALPSTPAIIQTTKVASDLNLDLELCERALERISEDHERVNRIRNGAYMIRQKRSIAKVE